MSTQVDTTRLILNRIFHPSDCSPASEVAFAHALKLALITRAELRMMHVALDEEDIHWSDFPGVRATLARYGTISMRTLPIWSCSQHINVPGWHAGCTGRWRNQ
jgi:hypothetical protein